MRTPAALFCKIRYLETGRPMVEEKELEEHRKKFDKCRRAFHALGNDARQELCMILMMHSSGLRVTDLARRANLSRSVVSQHMKILKDAGIAKVRKEGTFIYYYLDMESSVSDQMMAYFQSVKNILSRMPDRTGE